MIVPGGAISITQSSNISLKEPLEARFYDNRAIEGSAICVEEDSRMYIKPNRFYSLKNITEIEIALNFRNNTNYFNAPNSLLIQESYFIPLLKSPKFLFRPRAWDSEHNHYAYSTVLDVILKEMDEFDKFTSLPNGICWQLHGKKWNCTYVDHYLHMHITSPGFISLASLYRERAISISLSLDVVLYYLQLDAVIVN